MQTIAIQNHATIEKKPLAKPDFELDAAD